MIAAPGVPGKRLPAELNRYYSSAGLATEDHERLLRKFADHNQLREAAGTCILSPAENGAGFREGLSDNSHHSEVEEADLDLVLLLQLLVKMQHIEVEILLLV